MHGPAAASSSHPESVDFEPSDESARRRRLLLMSYWCHPDTGMEARIGWYRAIQAAKWADTRIVLSNAEDLDFLTDRIEAAGVSDSLHLVCLAPSRIERVLARYPQSFYWSYELWLRRALKVAQQLHREAPFDLAHQVSFCGYRQPGHIRKLGIPFVFGPVGGTQNFPWRFLPAIGWAGAAREAVRNVVNSWQLYYSRTVRSTCRDASAVVAANSTGQRDLSRTQDVPVIQHLETGVERCSAPPQRQRKLGEPIRILWTGRLESWKALPLLLNALALLPKSFRYELRILGIGKCRERWQRLAEQLGIANSVDWRGWGTYSELLSNYPWADVFAFTSLRDTSGSGLLEALAAGVPIIGVNHQGAADIMTAQCAIPIPVTRPEETIAAFRDAILAIANDPARLQRLSDGARARATHFLWQRQGDFIDRLYQQVLHGEKVAVTTVEPEFAALDKRLRIPAVSAQNVAAV